MPKTVTPPAAPAQDRGAVLAAERERRQQIRERFGRFAAEYRDLLDECLDDPAVTPDMAASRLLDRLGSRHQPLATPTGTSEVDDFVAAASDALLMRAGIRVERPHAAARDVATMSLTDVAMVCLDRDPRGRSAIMRRERGDVFRAALTTSDFPAILEDALHKAVRRGFETEPASHRAWVRVQPVTDFRDQHRPILGSAPELKPVAERGPYELGAFDEDSTAYRVQKFGRMIDLSWEALKNDTLGIFLARIPPALGQAARRREADAVYDLFAENGGAGPTMQDSTALFDASHANVADAQAAFNAAALSAGRLLLRKMTAVGGGLLSLVPRYLIVPAELETDAEMLIAAATVHRTGIDTNDQPGTASRQSTTSATTPEWIARLQLVVEPRLADDAFYLACDPNQIDTCELGVLDENISGPTIVQEETFNIDSMRWKVRHVFRPAFLDWRGIVKVPLASE